MSWGQHLILNAGRCAPKTVRCANTISQFSKKLVKDIDMVPQGGPQIQHFGSGNKAGYTLVQLIETSNITAHFVEETNDVQLDVFSCKPFNPEVVKAIVQEVFHPQSMESVHLTRQAPRPKDLE